MKHSGDPSSEHSFVRARERVEALPSDDSVPPHTQADEASWQGHGSPPHDLPGLQAHEAVPDSAVQRESLLRAVDHVPAGVVVTDRRGRVVYVNRAFTRITGYSFDDVAWTTPRVLRSGVHSSEFYQEMWASIAAGREWSGELWNRRKNGELYWETLTISPVLDAQGEVDQFVAVLEDATRYKRADERLRLANEAVVAAERARSTFLASISHEIRTPLTAVLGFAQLLQADPTFPPSHREKLDSISSAGAHLLGLLNDVLEISRIGAGQATLKPTVLEIPLFFRDLHRMFRPTMDARGLRFELVVHEDTPSQVITDSGRLRQVLINLLGNAVKFTEHGGVSLHVSSTANETDRCTLVMEVVDSGPGIDKDEMEHLFQPFAQTAAGRKLGGGSGLGLTLSRDYVHLLGGEIVLTSHLGEGTTVKVTLPVRRSQEGDEEPAELGFPLCHLKQGLPRPRVLVVDDNVQGRILLSRLLQRAGFETREASDGDEAVGCFEEWKPDLVLMDLWMPGVDGFEATRRIRASEGGHDTRIIAMTTRPFAQGATDAVMAGADDFLTHPMHDDEVFDKIRHVLGVEFDSQDVESERRHPELSTRVRERLSRDDLGLLPPHLVEALRQATALLDFELLGQVADAAEAVAPEVATHLRELLSRFDHRTLAKLLGEEVETP